MKFFLIFISFFSSALFACGCVDAPSAASGAKLINQTFDVLDNQFSDKIKKLEKKIQETIDKETDDKDKMSKNVSLDKYKILELENAIFTTQKIKVMR